MSLNQITTTSDIGKILEHILEQEGAEGFKEYLKSRLSEAYGRWENPSGMMFFEIWHNDSETVNWRYGERMLEDGIEPEILSIGEAVSRAQDKITGGYSLKFRALTAEEMAEGRRKELESLPRAEREHLLGDYAFGKFVKRFIRLGDDYAEEDVYSGSLQAIKHYKKSEMTLFEQAIADALSAGYIKVEHRKPKPCDLSKFF